jgi:hypothetical protein
MKFAFFICASSLIWMISCAAIERTKNKPDESAEIWSHILAVVNQDLRDNAYLSEDLSQTYADELADIETKWGKVSTGNHRKKNEFFHKQIVALNNHGFEKLGLGSPPKESYKDVLEAVLRGVESHPSARSEQAYAYDQGDQIGFCFGRALLTHYLLLKQGIPQEHIRKIFALGNLRLLGQFWQFHVAILVRDSRGYTVVDPLYGEPTTLDAWKANVASLDIKPTLARVRFYVADPRKFMPTGGRYSHAALNEPLLKQYFVDMAQGLKLGDASWGLLPGRMADSPALIRF